MTSQLAALLFFVTILANLGCVQNSKDTITLIDFRNRQSIEAQRPFLIAHRGGVVTDKTPECSLAAIRLAGQQGYAMVELDIQQSRDYQHFSSETKVTYADIAMQGPF